MEKLTLNQAVAQFHAILREHLPPEPLARAGPSVPETHEEAEARRFRLAETLLRLACPDARRCTDHRCRRSGRCRHLADLAARKQGPPRRQEDDRPPAAHALRHAIWVYMNAQLALANATPSKA